MPKLKWCLALVTITAAIGSGITVAGTVPAPTSPMAVATDPRVTIPLWGEQWQPERDQADTRLSQTVSIWEKEVRLAEALEKVGRASGVSLQSADTLHRMRVTIVGEGGTLAGLMLSLSDLFDAYWVYRKEESPTQRTYLLVEHHPVVGSYDDWADRQAAEARERACAPLRPEWEARLALYQHALTLPPEEVLKQYEGSDPWLCATLLDPQERPKIEAVCSLKESDRERLISGEGLTVPLSAFPPAFGEYLRNYLTSALPIESEQPPRRQQQTGWSKATVGLAWGPQWLSAHVASPSQMSLIDFGICLPTLSPRRARDKLVDLGYAKDTPERRVRVEQEEREWQAAHPTPPPERMSELIAAATSTPPDLSDARLEHRIDLTSLTESHAPISDLLALVAKQCGMCVVAQARRRDQSLLRLPQQLRTEGTLGAVLAEIGKYRDWSWRFRGAYLVVSYQHYRADAARELPPEFVSAWGPKLQAGNVLDLDELATALAGLNGPQSARVNWALRKAGISEAPASPSSWTATLQAFPMAGSHSSAARGLFALRRTRRTCWKRNEPERASLGTRLQLHCPRLLGQTQREPVPSGSHQQLVVLPL